MGTAVVRAYLGLGSNLGQPREQVRTALRAINGFSGTRCVAHSRLFRSRPMGQADQPDYINAVAAVDTCLTPHALLACMQAQERRQGRVRDGRRWGARCIDMDLLLFAEMSIETPSLRVPHPGLSERDFVLRPLAEIAPPDLVVPGYGPLRDLLQRHRAVYVQDTIKV